MNPQPLTTEEKINSVLNRYAAFDILPFSQRGSASGDCIATLERQSGGVYHPPFVGPLDRWMGMRWQDMPGHDDEVRRMNFALFRRGIYDPHGDSVFRANQASAARAAEGRRKGAA